MMMTIILKLALSVVLVFGWGTAIANASPLTYIIGNNDAEGSHHFGTVDLTSGVFQQIGPNAPVGTEGLAWGPNGSLLTLAYNSDLYSINPVTGTYTRIGPTGLGDCSTPASPCGPTSNLTLGGANGKVYATDFQNRLYSLNPATGAATLIGTTGIPAIPFVPASLNPDETINFYEESLFGASGNLYATFDAFAFDFTTLSPKTVAVPPALYRIDPSTGMATLIAPTDLAIGAVVRENGGTYGFNLLQSTIFTLDLNNGSTTIVGATDPAAGVVRGAAPVPEPGTLAFVGIGIALAAVRRASRA